ncbi:MAG: acyltransferase [Chloroflexi bacterium]|nr:acyltransferase [Chloroflexota bacterium]
MSETPGLATRYTQRLIRRVKGDPDYRIESNLAPGDLVEVLMRRGKEAVRGRWLRRTFGASDGLVLAGRRIIVRNGRRIRVGRTILIGDDVILDALSTDGITLGTNVTIGRGSTLQCSGVLARPGVGIQIGDRTGLNEYCHLGGQGGLKIGSDVIFGPGVRVFTENHRFDDTDRPIRLQGEVRAPVVIGDNCWIGAGVVILAGVTIESGAVVGAGSVVTRDVGAGVVVVGNPAREVRDRVPSRS